MSGLPPDFCVFDGGTGDEGTELPRRPSTDDLGGDEKLDDAEFPPDPVEHPTAAGHNQLVKVTAGLAKTAAACKLEVDFNSGVPFVKAASALSSLVSLATFGTPTDNGTGDTTVTWPANTFPPETVSPNGLTLYSSATQPTAGQVEKVTNGIRVRTFLWNGSAWALSNIPWSINLN